MQWKGGRGEEEREFLFDNCKQNTKNFNIWTLYLHSKLLISNENLNWTEQLPSLYIKNHPVKLSVPNFRNHPVKLPNLYFKNHPVKLPDLYFKNQLVKLPGLYFRNHPVILPDLYFKNHPVKLPSPDIKNGFWVRLALHLYIFYIYNTPCSNDNHLSTHYFAAKFIGLAASPPNVKEEGEFESGGYCKEGAWGI